MEHKDHRSLSEHEDQPPSKSQRPISFCVLSEAVGPHGGLVVQSVDKLSAPGKVGVLAGDEIVGVAGQRPTSPDKVVELLREAGIGATVAVQIVRGQAQATLAMPVEARTLTLDLDDLDEVVERKIAPAA